MVLSNAARQQRYRERLKRAARGDLLPQQIAVALDAAFKAAWAELSRPTVDGRPWADAEDYADAAALAASFRGNPKGAREYLLSFLDPELHQPSEVERSAIELACCVLSAACLTPPSKQ
jgi:hypothetical protein